MNRGVFFFGVIIRPDYEEAMTENGVFFEQLSDIL